MNYCNCIDICIDLLIIHGLLTDHHNAYCKIKSLKKALQHFFNYPASYIPARAVLCSWQLKMQLLFPNCPTSYLRSWFWMFFKDLYLKCCRHQVVVDVKHSEDAATGISREDRKHFARLHCPRISPAPPGWSAVIQIIANRYYWQGEAGKVSWKGTLPKSGDGWFSRTKETTWL